MRIIYYTQAFFSDCDLPLIREFQRKNLKIRVYIPIQSYRKRSGIIDLKELKKRIGIFKASSYKELLIYKDYVDLNKIYIINLPDRSKNKDRLIWLLTFLHMCLFRPNIFHFNWQLSGRERWLYHLPVHKCMTVHDPFSHSSVKDPNEEKERLLAFKNSNRFILLNTVQKPSFCKKYNIPEQNVDISRLGEFNHLRVLKSESLDEYKPYILFFGQILSYKGLEYLCEAMIDVHKKYPKHKLIIAGSGDIYFDYTKYAKLDYILLKNYYVSIKELAGLVKNALFSVCPYIDATQSGVVQTSFSCNTPVIVTNVGALAKYVENGITGLVIPPCDRNSLSLAIIDLLSHPEKIEQFRNNISKKWRPTMGWDSIAKIYLRFYEKMID